ncbi:unnamed protein product [Brassica rapa subsp. trilocularis]
MDDDGELSLEETLKLMYAAVGGIFLWLVFLSLYVFFYVRQWLSLDKPSYTNLRTDEGTSDQDVDQGTNILNRV